MRVYIASLSDYNAGKLLGAWIDLEGKDADEIQAEIDAILATSKEDVAEEWAVHDYETASGLKVSEWESPASLAKLAEIDALSDEYEPECVEAATDCLADDADADDIREWIDDHYRGTYRDMGEFAEELLEESGTLKDVPDDLARYFDFDAYGRDLVYGGSFFTRDCNEGVRVFWND